MSSPVEAWSSAGVNEGKSFFRSSGIKGFADGISGLHGHLSKCSGQPPILPTTGRRSRPDHVRRRPIRTKKPCPIWGTSIARRCVSSAKKAGQKTSRRKYICRRGNRFTVFEAGTNCRAWLYKILFHCVNHHRRKWFRFPLLKETEEFMEANLTAPEPVPEHLSDADILSALDGVPGDYRAVVLLVDVEEFAYKEAAEILDIPIGTVMSRLSRGRKQLREKLKDVARSYGIGTSVGGQV